jgi:hypothetical protein
MDFFRVKKLGYLPGAFAAGGDPTGVPAEFPVGAGMFTGRPSLSTKMSWGT